ncbi:hypothetical protein [Providencia heimbachae]|uniref:Uncharacterized protein n=1 Tax=Providencia heimbachae ATCC 35613 TaxID=1354272 RepID=A0A1B7K1K9_9GAMM|nr:hypothetical protein [Providencia heimbachae]OAT54019.1 hypothetical protein M998_0700 [Providencia heimbachae ATCC 35613]SQH13758.1 Uncharacterised protein [Providencia heimbachae]
MTTPNSNLINIIRNAGNDPSDITDAIFLAGYRKTDFSIEQIIEMTADQTASCIYLGMKYDALPRTINDIAKYHLSGLIEEASWIGTPEEIAAEVLRNGYQKGDDK